MPTLTGLLLAGIIAAPLSTVALFTPARRPRRVAGAWPSFRRLTCALAGTAALAAVTAAALLLLGERPAITVQAAAALALLSLCWMPVTMRWNARAHLAWAATVFLFLTYLAFILQWTFASRLSAANTVAGLVLWLFEVAAAILACAYLWELCDALGTQRMASSSRTFRTGPATSQAPSITRCGR